MGLPMSLIDEAKKGIPTEVRRAARRDNIEPERLRRLLVSGRAVVPCNPVHAPEPVGIGEGLRVKINVNIGTSRDHCVLKEELLKARTAISLGADAIMDLSTGGDTRAIRKAILKAVRIPLGTVPIYETALECIRGGRRSMQAGRSDTTGGGRHRANRIVDMTEDAIFNTIERQAKEGVDFMTVHCGITRESVTRLKRSGRITDIVSRGGAFLSAWLLHNKKENPLYANFDYLLELARKYEFTLSLGDGLRPGCIADATDRPQLQELIILGELVDRARKAKVQAMVEGPGHVPLNQIEANVRVQKTVCKGAPFYVLGPLVTDIAPGYDHITSAIGGALAGFFGADFICYVTPSEHLSLPTIEDVRQGTVAAQIAAHAADLARGNGWERDIAMARARKALDWDGQFRQALDPERARSIRDRHRPKKSKRTCTMCGDLCAMAIDDEYV
jgi:phosphomethylpyrimidine synthase